MKYENIMTLCMGLAVFGLGVEVGVLFGGDLLAVIFLGLYCGWGGFCVGMGIATTK
jgi:hypothetical protein